MMKKWRDTLVLSSMSVQQVLEIIDNNSMQIALVVDPEGRLLGTVTDGDVRRGILKGVGFSEPITMIMNSHPTVAGVSESKETILAMMKQKEIHQIPVVDDKGLVAYVETLGGLIGAGRRDNLVVVMAGGRGTRLHPLTSDCPKPLLKVGGTPVLETILQSFLEYGFYRFCFTVHYKAEMIEAYFGNGSKWGAEITYIREKEKMGTAGALGMIGDIPPLPVIVMNGDVLTKVNYSHLLSFHEEQSPDATMCVREYKTQIPYGVVRLSQQQIQAIEEKPVFDYFVSAGINVFEPAILRRISISSSLDMPEFFNALLQEKRKVVAFPVREYWMDIGRMSDFERANGDFSEVFG